MNNDLRNEMLVVLNTENVCDDFQIRILHCCSKFMKNHEYTVWIAASFKKFSFSKWICHHIVTKQYL